MDVVVIRIQFMVYLLRCDISEKYDNLDTSLIKECYNFSELTSVVEEIDYNSPQSGGKHPSPLFIGMMAALVIVKVTSI